MSRMINADALCENLGFAKNCNDCKIGKNCTYETFSVYGICTALADAPTVDAVPVVRCKDCKHAMMTTDGNMCKYCDLYKDDDGFPIELYLEADWFCAGGERRDDNV